MGLLHYIRQRVRSFGYAFRGIYFLISGTPHARLHLLATAVVAGLGWYCGVRTGEWALLLLAMGLVWAAEGFNSALETLADRVSTEQHPLTGRAKDLAAGAVLLAAIFAAGVGLLVFLPHLF
jgi:diacylglycerol kinase (ATP)